MQFNIFDTETSGMFDFKLPADAPGQPRLAQYAGRVVNPDGSKGERFQMYVKPDGWEMDPGATKVNGLTDEFLHDNGLPVGEVLDHYTSLIAAGCTMAAYNAQFDLKVMRAELRRAGRPDLFESTLNVCLMRPLTDVLCIPSPRFKGRYKWPSLAEALDHFGITNAAAHDAVGDMDATVELFIAMRDAGLLPAPAVHFAKEKT